MANNRRKRIISQVDPKYISKDWREKKLRVAAYARVSTDSSDQENSLKNQLRHYAKFIPLHPQWEYVGTFSDEYTPYGLNPKSP
jgi:site-specific DNA recombinase